MNREGDLPVSELWRSSWVLALATGIASVIAALAFRHVPGLSLWQDFQMTFVACLMAGLLFLQRKKPRAPVCGTAFITIVASMMVTMTVNQYQLSVSGRAFFLPLAGHKAMLLVIGFIAPPPWLGALSISALTLGGILQTMLLAPGAVPFRGEPLVTCAIAGVAAGLLVMRTRARATERALAITRAEAMAAERLAMTFLAIRDLANTPLQTLTSSTSLLELREGADLELVARMKRALAQLERLNEILAAEEAQGRVDWRHLEGFDPWQELAERLGRAGKPSAPT
jgi:hypothetical protein